MPGVSIREKMGCPGGLALEAQGGKETNRWIGKEKKCESMDARRGVVYDPGTCKSNKVSPSIGSGWGKRSSKTKRIKKIKQKNALLGNCETGAGKKNKGFHLHARGGH